MQLLTFMYADWDLTLSQALWHKISQKYPSTPSNVFLKKNMKSHTDTLNIFSFVLLYMQATRETNIRCTHSHMHKHTRVLLPLSGQATVNNHSAVTRAQHFMQEEDAEKGKSLAFSMICARICIHSHKLLHVAFVETIMSWITMRWSRRGTEMKFKMEDHTALYTDTDNRRVDLHF